MMKHLLLSLVLPCLAAAVCLPLLRNKAETAMLIARPEHVKRWNTATGQFDEFGTLKANNTAFCSIRMVKDMRGKMLIVSVDPREPYIKVYATSPNARISGVTGFIGDIWTTLEEVLKFKTIYRRAKWKYVRTQMNDDTHALLSPIVVNAIPSSFYTYSMPLTTDSYALFLQSEGERISGKWYTGNFSNGLWLISSGFVVCIAFSIIGIYHVKRFTTVNYKEYDDFSSLSYNLLYVLGGISGQGFQKIPNSWSMRLIILSCLLMGMLLSCGFSSTLISSLTNRGNFIPLDSLEDLAIKRTHSLCIRNDSSAYAHFTTNNTVEGDIQDQWKRLINRKCPDIEDTATFMSHLCQPGFVYLETARIFLSTYRKAQHNCDIVKLPTAYWKSKVSFVHKKTSQYRHLIDTYLIRMRSAGIFTYLERKWISMKIHPSNSLQWNTFRPVKYQHVHIAFFEFTIMVIISIIICILENIWYKLQLKIRKMNSNSILLGKCDNSVNAIKTYRKTVSRFVRRRKVNSILLPANIKNPEFRQNIRVRVNHW